MRGKAILRQTHRHYTPIRLKEAFKMITYTICYIIGLMLTFLAKNFVDLIAG